MRRALVVGLALVAGCAAAHDGGVRPPKNLSPLEKKLADNPNDGPVNLALGEEAERMGDWLRAEQYYLRAEALGQPAQKLVPRILRVLVQARRYDEALERCRRQLAAAPGDRATRQVEAALYAALDRPHDAERDLEIMVRLQPADPHPYLALGQLYRDAYHDDARARQMFERFLALAPKGNEAEALRVKLEEDALSSDEAPLPALPAPAPSSPAATAPSSPAATAPSSPPAAPAKEPNLEFAP